MLHKMLPLSPANAEIFSEKVMPGNLRLNYYLLTKIFIGWNVIFSVRTTQSISYLIAPFVSAFANLTLTEAEITRSYFTRGYKY